MYRSNYWLYSLLKPLKRRTTISYTISEDTTTTISSVGGTVPVSYLFSRPYYILSTLSMLPEVF